MEERFKEMTLKEYSKLNNVEVVESSFLVLPLKPRLYLHENTSAVLAVYNEEFELIFTLSHNYTLEQLEDIYSIYESTWRVANNSGKRFARTEMEHEVGRVVNLFARPIVDAVIEAKRNGLF